MKIDFKENGFEFEKNGEKTFLSYQSIESISDVVIREDYQGSYDFLRFVFTDEYAEKQVFFRVETFQDSYKITLDNFKVVYATCTQISKIKSLFIWKICFRKLLTFRTIRKEISQWFDDDSNVKDIVEETKKLREQLIDNFNKWKNK
jgi:hypothetical protein